MDSDYLDKWKEWTSGQKPLLAEKIDQEMQPAEIAFLGVWDTVPGSSAKEYGYCRENRGILKRYFWWLIPGIDSGQRYKTDSYPPIRLIAHAVSKDEKRSKFSPLLLCPAIENTNPTTYTEVWFPGAHADVGGGYEDSNELAGISLNWMVKLLGNIYPPATSFAPVPENALGLAHWSIGDSPANAFSECIDRAPPAGAKIDGSVVARKIKGMNKINKDGKEQNLEYPISCAKK